MVAVTLSWSELRIAAEVGTMRRMNAMRKQRSEPYGFAEGFTDFWTVDIEAAAAEMAVAKLLNIYWTGMIARIEAGDVAQYEVRSTRYANGSLILRKSDNDNAPFLLVTGTAPNFDIVGWLYAREGKRERHWKDPTGGSRPAAYFVPQPFLHPIRTLNVYRRETAA